MTRIERSRRPEENRGGGFLLSCFIVNEFFPKHYTSTVLPDLFAAGYRVLNAKRRKKPRRDSCIRYGPTVVP